MPATNVFQPTYADWKTARTTLAGVTYYVKHDFHYIGILVKEVSGVVDVYLVELCRTAEDPNVSDFETNIIPTAVLVTTVDDAITQEIL